jgi:hypothetical protein
MGVYYNGQLAREFDFSKITEGTGFYDGDLDKKFLYKDGKLYEYIMEWNLIKAKALFQKLLYELEELGCELMAYNEASIAIDVKDDLTFEQQFKLYHSSLDSIKDHKLVYSYSTV